MKFSSEQLMAYADGELDAETRAAIEAAIAEDPQVAAAVEAELQARNALQAKLRGALDGVLAEPVPQRLLETVRAEPQPVSAPVVDLAAARAAKSPSFARQWSLPQWGAIAASLIIGVLIGRVAFREEAQLVLAHEGRMVAQGALDAALTDQVGSTIDRETGIRVGVSYVAKSGDYCRTFTVSSEQTLAGLACRRDTRWAVDALTRTTANPTSAYRMAGIEVPALILSIVENTISGDPLDAEQEAEARTKGWRR